MEQHGAVGVLRLNRPKALNALSLGMIRTMDQALTRWAADPDVKAVVAWGEGGRAFCSGGDVRSIWQDAVAAREGRGNGSLTVDFFREEYSLNRRIHRYPKPYIALCDGIVMGGGVGVSAHGTHSVYTERTLFAMPEMAIGFFPDVGSGWLLNQKAPLVGMYLALTGARLKAADTLLLGVRAQTVESQTIDALRAALLSAEWNGDAHETATGIIGQYAIPAGDPELAPHLNAIERCFQKPTVEEIIDSLQAEPSGWAHTTAALMLSRSPTSMKVALRQLRECAGLEVEDVLSLDFRLSQGCMRGNDFYEGIRAVLVDKDHSARWNPPRLEEVTSSTVDSHFAPTPAGELRFEP